MARTFLGIAAVGLVVWIISIAGSSLLVRRWDSRGFYE